ncbi:MAG: hypothetical protein K9G33_02800 [Sneathiella sp.]|nr:hypothetical protein [Sneathiella sp.]
MWNWLCRLAGRTLVHYLETPVHNYISFSVSDPDILRQFLQPGDILLVEGNERISIAIKYLTQSTWSHAALFVGGSIGGSTNSNEMSVLIEANLAKGVIAVPLSKYCLHNTRICRPVGLTDNDRLKLITFAINAIGTKYDLKNVIDLARYLVPTPPVPVRWRRRMLSLGSGDPTQAICSTLIAKAFQSVQYPILPQPKSNVSRDFGVNKEILQIRHHSLFVPRDFDISPYFQVIKPTIEQGFNYRDLCWADES